MVTKNYTTNCCIKLLLLIAIQSTSVANVLNEGNINFWPKVKQMFDLSDIKILCLSLLFESVFFDIIYISRDAIRRADMTPREALGELIYYLFKTSKSLLTVCVPSI